MNETISVIVPVYKVEDFLPRCVDSILGQTYPNLDVILVDDGSPDGSGAICDAYAARDSRVRVIHKENGGLSSARNAGIDAARGEYLAFVDSDDWIQPDAYATMLNLMKQNQADLVCAGRYDVDGESGEKTVGLCPAKEETVTGEELAGRIFLWDGCDSSACDKLYSRTLFGDFRYPVGMLSEDVAVTYRIVLGCRRAVMCPRPFYNYFHRPGSISQEEIIHDKTFHFPRHAAEIYSYIRQHHPAIEPQARYLRVRSLSYVLLVVEKRPGGENYREEYRQARKELWTHLGFLLTYPRFGAQERLTDLLLALGIYGPLQRLYHTCKGSKL